MKMRLRGTTSQRHPSFIRVTNGTGVGQLQALSEADVVLVVDSDIPWIPVQSKPSDSARVYHIDSDPLKTSMTLWGLPCVSRWQCESSLALRQLYTYMHENGLSSDAAIRERIMARTETLRRRFEVRKQSL
jgi:acetolactate synthase-1/2/3 large subunit